MSKGKVLIGFAWLMEIVGVFGGVINSAYTTFGDDLPHSIVGYVPVVPMFALAVAELGRVPLTSVLFYKHKVMQCVAILGLAALGYLAVENWTFGFERIVDLRLKPVNASTSELLTAKENLSTLQEQYKGITEGGRQKRDELRRAIEQRDTSIANISKQITEEAELHQKNLEGIREACRIIRDKCMMVRSKAEDIRYEKEVAQLSGNLQRERQERNRLQSEIDELVSVDAKEAASLNQKIGEARNSVSVADEALRAAAAKNQIYRLAASWYGVSTHEVTDLQFSNARWVFSTFSATAVALAGSIAALVFYARNRVPGDQTTFEKIAGKVGRARRKYYARKRKPIVRELPGPERVVYRDGKEPPTVVEKEVVRLVDQIFLIPRWGIKAPVHINSLLRRGENNRDVHSESADGATNVTPLKQKVS